MITKSFLECAACVACVAATSSLLAISYDPFNPNPTQWDVDQARQEEQNARRAADDMRSLSLRVSGSDWQTVTSKEFEFDRQAKEHSWNAQQLEDRMWENRRKEEQCRQEEEWRRQEENRRQEEEWQRQQEQRRQEEEWQRQEEWRRKGQRRRQDEQFQEGQRRREAQEDDGQIVPAQHKVVGATEDARFNPPCPQPGDARTFDTWVYKVRAYWRKVGVRYGNTIDAEMWNYYNAHLGEKAIDKLMGVKSPAQVVEDGCPDPKDYKSERTFVEAYVKFKAKGRGKGQVDYQTRRYFYADAHMNWDLHRKTELKNKLEKGKALKEYCAATEEYARAIESQDPSDRGVFEAAKKRYEESRRKYKELGGPVE